MHLIEIQARLVRDGTVVHDGRISTLRRFNDDAREVQTGYECGITLENYQDVKEGDVIEVMAPGGPKSYEITKVKYL